MGEPPHAPRTRYAYTQLIRCVLQYLADTGVRNGKVTKEAALRYLKSKWNTSLPESMFNQEWIKIDPLSKKVQRQPRSENSCPNQEIAEREYDKLCSAVAARVKEAMLRALDES